MRGIEVESQRSPAFEEYCDPSAVLGLWQMALLDPKAKHIHLEGPRYVGKTYLLRASLALAEIAQRAVMFLEPSLFQQPDWVDVRGGDWFFFDDVERLDLKEQSVFIAWLDAAIASGVKVVTSSGPLNLLTSFSPDLRSRLQSACPVLLSYPEETEDWSALVHAFFRHRYIEVPDQVVRVLLRLGAGYPEYLFRTMEALSQQSERLTVARARAAYGRVVLGP